MKWLGSALIFCGGFWWWRLCLLGRRQEKQTLERLLMMLYQLREGIRMARLPLPQLLDRAAQDEAFFGEVLRELREQEELSEAWGLAAENLPLPPQSWKIWCWLGRHLTGDEQSVLQAMTYAEQIMAQERQRLAEQEQEVNRRTAAMCFSAAALAVILLV